MFTGRSSDNAFVSVIVPHYNQHAALAECLESLRTQSMPRDQFEIIVIDNDSDDGVDHLKAAFPEVMFLHEPKRGAAHARNAGLDAANGDIIAFTDADCTADHDWLSEGAAALSETDLSGGAVHVSFQDAKAPTSIELFERIFAFQQETYINRKQFSVTANLFVRRETAEAVGPFKNDVAEDFEWCRRAAALGFRLAFNDRSIINHPARRDWAELTAKWRRLVEERWNGFGGFGPFRKILWAGLSVATALSIAPHSAKVLFTGKVAGISRKLSVIAVLARIRFWRAKRMLTLLA